MRRRIGRMRTKANYVKIRKDFCGKEEKKKMNEEEE